MATKQTVMWTALPNGVRTGKDGTQYLRLAGFMSPRLTSTSTPPLTLGMWPDFATGDPAVNWASTVAGLTFHVEFRRRAGGTVYRIPATAVRRASQSDPTLWSQLFGTGTPVDGYVPPDLRNVRVNSFAVKEASAALRDHVAAIASAPALLHRVPAPEEIINPGGMIDNPLTAHLAGQIQSAGTMNLMAAPAPSGPTLYEQYTEFHRPYMTAQTWKSRTPAELAAERETDFHKSMTALGNYPALLPLLGIVVNFEITLTQAVLAELNGASRVRVRPQWPAGGSTVTREDAYPWTVIAATGKSTTRGYQVTSFRAAPKTGDLKNGYLVVRDTSDDGANDPVSIANIDMDLALGKIFARFDGIVQQINSRVLPQTMSTMSTPEVQTTQEFAIRDDIQAGLPTLGQPTIALSINKAGEKLAGLLSTTQVKNKALIEGNHTQIVHNAEELVRGYRVDVWDSVTKVWHPLCERIGTYRLGDAQLTWNGDNTELVDEAWVQLATQSDPADDSLAPQEMRLSEEMFSWNGWSLVIERPGAALAEAGGSDATNTMRRTYVGPDGETHPLGEFDNPGLPLATSFRVRPGSLPRLRFGTTYRFRARAVDLAGNSVPFDKGAPTDTPGGTDDKLTTVTRALVHKRYEAVKPPVVVIRHDLVQSESPQHLVVRSNYNTTPAAPTSRHICPPRTSFTMSEAHGAFDDTTAGKPMDGSTARYARISSRDAWDFPHNALPPTDPAHGQQVPLPEIPKPLPYLADVPSRGASFTGLPGQKDKAGKVNYVGKDPVLGSTSVKLPDDTTVVSGAFRIPFDVGTSGDDGDRRPFKLIVTGVEGTDPRLPVKTSQTAPTWNATKRELRVALPKAEQVEAEVSSFVNASDLNVFGEYQWGVAKSILEHRPQLFSSLMSTSALASSVMTPKTYSLPLQSQTILDAVTNSLVDLSVLGNNWTITPADKLTLVHAVQQPMIAPNLTNSLKVHGREQGDTAATLVDWVQIHGKSTARIAMNARWTEEIDDPADGLPKWGDTAVGRSGQAFDLAVGRGDTVALSMMKPAPPGVTLPVTPVTTNRDAKAQRHSFGDTKHRFITYSLVASSRFQKYFPAEAETTRGGNTKRLHIPSSARPVRPDVDLVIPAFKWTRSISGTSSQRGGGRLRVYLKRPWFSSGDGEKLAVLLWQSSNPIGGYDKLRPYVTEWGNDPLYRSRGSIPVKYPSPANFEDYSSLHYFKYPAEVSDGPLYVTVLVYEVDYDEESERWFADITLKQGNAYFPFVKLALARYQRWALPNLQLSPTVEVDAVQLTPDRTASVMWAQNALSFTVNVNGRSYEEARSGYGPLMTMSVERRQADGFAWLPYQLPGQTVTEFEMETYQPNMLHVGQARTYWRRTVALRSALDASDYRLVIREYERHFTGATMPTISGTGQVLGARPVYVDVLPLKPPLQM